MPEINLPTKAGQDNIISTVNTVNTNVDNVKTNVGNVNTNVNTVKSDVSSVKTITNRIESDTQDIQSRSSRIEADTQDIQSKVNLIKNDQFRGYQFMGYFDESYHSNDRVVGEQVLSITGPGKIAFKYIDGRTYCKCIVNIDGKTYQVFGDEAYAFYLKPWGLRKNSVADDKEFYEIEFENNFTVTLDYYDYGTSYLQYYYWLM
jgi:hypothetical protein